MRTSRRNRHLNSKSNLFKKAFTLKTYVTVFLFTLIIDALLTALLGEYMDKYPILNIIYLLPLYLILLTGYLLANWIERIKKYYIASWLILVLVILFMTVMYVPFVNSQQTLGITLFIFFCGILVSYLFLVTIQIKKFRKKHALSSADFSTKNSRFKFNFWKTAAIILFAATAFSIINSSIKVNELNIRLATVENKLGGKERLSCTEKDSINKVRESVVRIIGGEAEGSGFAIDNNLILTNFHVIEFEPSPKIVFQDSSFETAEIIMADKDADLAILKVNKKLQKITWGNPSSLDPSEELLAIGFPLGGDLKGEASVNKGFLAARRFSKDVGIEYIQIDGTLNPGVSGGPMIDVCGKVVGVNTAGMAGLGLAISSDSVMDKWGKMSLSDDPLKDVEKIDIEPNKSSLDAVKAFYNYLKLRKLPKAFELLSKNFRKDYSYDYWVSGYKDLLDTTVIKIEQGESENFVKVRLATKNLTDGDIVYKYFEGQWEVRKVKDKWQLWDAKIKEVKEPDYLWFYD